MHSKDITTVCVLKFYINWVYDYIINI